MHLSYFDEEFVLVPLENYPWIYHLKKVLQNEEDSSDLFLLKVKANNMLFLAISFLCNKIPLTLYLRPILSTKDANESQTIQELSVQTRDDIFELMMSVLETLQNTQSNNEPQDNDYSDYIQYDWQEYESEKGHAPTIRYLLRREDFKATLMANELLQK